MAVFVSILQLIRWPNLIFVVLAQVLFYGCVLPVTSGPEQDLSGVLFAWLVAASICIPAAGYIINDLYDVEIDRVNKPHRVFIGDRVSKPLAWGMYGFLNVAGLVFSLIVSAKLQNWWIAGLNTVAIGLLWMYSFRLKKKLLSGNFVVSALTAWSILIIPVAAGLTEFLLFHGLLYSSFAFILSLVREVVKDLEDMPGDATAGCETLPLLFGTRMAKLFAVVWLIVLVLLVLLVQIQIAWWPVIFYAAATVQLPLMYCMNKLTRAQTPQQYHRLSSLLKWVMLMGILSMLFYLKI